MRVLNNINETLRAAYIWLAQCQYTENEIRQRLELAVGNNPDNNKLVYETMKSLKKENLLHDEWLAEKIARRYSHLSNSMIFKKLMAKGLSPQLASETISKLIPENIRAKRLAEQKWYDLAFEEMEVRKGIVKRYLESRGFSPILLAEALSSIIH